MFKNKLFKPKKVEKSINIQVSEKLTDESVKGIENSLNTLNDNLSPDELALLAQAVQKPTLKAQALLYLKTNV